MSQKILNSQQQPSPSNQAEASNASFTGWVEQRHLNTMSDSSPPKLDG